MTTPDSITVDLIAWEGPWPADDRDGNFKAEISLYSKLDPMQTITALGHAIDVPPGAIARSVLARWSSEGSAALLELGPSMVNRLYDVVATAEAAATDDARLAAYQKLRGMISWLHTPLE